MVSTRLPKTRCLSLRAVQRLQGPFFPLKKVPGPKKSKGGKRVSTVVKISQSQPDIPANLCGDTQGPRTGLLGLLDDTFAEVRHFGVLYFLLVQLILSPKE